MTTVTNAATRNTNVQATLQAPSRRKTGRVGTVARLLVGLVLLGSVLRGELAGPFRPAAWLLGLVGLPAMLLFWQWWRTHQGAQRLAATGPVGHALNIAVFLALYLTPWYAPTSPVWRR
jgi:hypothetical protein